MLLYITFYRGVWWKGPGANLATEVIPLADMSSIGRAGATVSSVMCNYQNCNKVHKKNYPPSSFLNRLSKSVTCSATDLISPCAPGGAFSTISKVSSVPGSIA